MKIVKEEIVYKSLDEIKEYENNPRQNDEAVEYVANSIKEFGFRNPIILDKDNVIIAGHTRYKASQQLKLKEVPCIYANDLTEEQVKAFRLADNKVGEIAEWDDDLLKIELDDILDIDMSDLGFDDIDLEEVYDEPKEKEAHDKLTNQFIIPPFSVFDRKAGYWLERKRAWEGIGIKSEKGREDVTVIMNTDKDYWNDSFTEVSVFDPVICEVIYKWFNIDNGKIYDCFAGGSVRGIVAEYLGYDYTGIDLRQKQVEANKEQAAKIGLSPKWYCDDSLNADKYIKDNSVDLVFSCPPYADLEVYSDDERDISNMNYEDFKKTYRKIIDIACRKLKDDRFAVFVVGDIRDKKGYYRNFIDYTKECFNGNGLLTYNEIIVLDPIGTAPVRCGRAFKKSRKVQKIHQNILVFYKGEIKNIRNNFKEIEVEEITE